MPWPPHFLFIGDTLAIDFVHSGGAGDRARWERWYTPDDLRDWSEASPDLGIRPLAGNADVTAAHALREALWRTARGRLAGAAPEPEDLALIEAHAACPDLVPVLRGGVRRWAEPAAFAQVLSAAARDAIDLFGTARAERFRECANPMCRLMFEDRSHAGRRRWCTMRRCGNLTKVARHRARKKGDDHVR